MKRLKTFVYRAGLEALYRSGAYRLGSLQDPGIGTILTLHHVRPEASTAYAPNRELEITPDFLDRAIVALAKAGVDFVSMEEVGRRLAQGGRSGRFVAFTLDDGYRDNLDVALPVFRRHKVPFTVFVTSGFVDHTAILWWKVIEEVIGRETEVVFEFPDESIRFPTATPAEKSRAAQMVLVWARSANPDVVNDRVLWFARRYGYDPFEINRREIMTPEELRRLAADPLATIGAHTRTHPNLLRLEAADALDEMVGGADELQAITGLRPTVFSYPYGSSAAAGEREFELARQAGFDLAVTTRPGMIRADHADRRLALPRLSLNGHFQTERHLDVLMSGAPFRIYQGLKRWVA